MKTYTTREGDRAAYGVFLLLLVFLLSIATSLAQQPTIVKSLPGYPGGDLPFTLETGYVGVGEREEVQLFYYFIESEKDVERDPLILWLTGGPACSGLSALVFEIGPFQFNLTTTNSESDPPKLQRNPYSWTKIASIIFLDSPVGTGFSYATTPEAYYSTDTLQATYIDDFLRKWLIIHPKFTNTPLYVGGDSYSGIPLPIVVQDILQGNEIGYKPRLNLKGYILGNPITEVNIMVNEVYKYAHFVSLLSDELYESAMISCNGDFGNVHAKNTKCLRNLQAIKQAIKSVNQGQVLDQTCPIKKLPPHNDQNMDPILLLPSQFDIKGAICRNEQCVLSSSWADNEQVREALHIREGTIGHWVRCNESISYEANVKSSVGYHQNSTRQPLQVLIYSGDHDMIAPYLNTLKWIKELEVPITDEWRPWFVDGQVAGYVTEFSRPSYQLVFTTIKGGSHTASDNRPRECFAMIERWLSLGPL